VPILHDEKAKPDDIFDSEEFQEILTTLRALAANDDRIIEYFRVISQGKRRSTRGTVVFDIDERLAKRINLEKFAREIELRCWRRLARLSWRPFESARSFVNGLGLRSSAEWYKYCKGVLAEKGSRPPDIPTAPQSAYADKGWISMGDWLGTGAVACSLKRYRSFTEARSFVRSLRLQGTAEWYAFCAGTLERGGTLPTDIPSNPQKTYANKGWSGMGDWLGTGREANFNKKFRSFKSARKFARGLGLSSGKEWKSFCKGTLLHKGTLPPDIPSFPSRTYATKGWISMGDWLGTGFTALYLRRYRSFSAARAFVRRLGLRNGNEWIAFCKGELPAKGKLPSDIPAAPSGIYAKQGWVGMGDWLGTGIVSNSLRRFRSFHDARDFVRGLNLKSQYEWSEFRKGRLPDKGSLPPDIPTNPNRTYADEGWAGIGDWLGTGIVAARLRRYRPFSEARDFARSLGLKTFNEWRNFCRGHLPQKGILPVDIPAAPQHTYANKGWAGVADWLGTGTVATFLRKYRSFKNARAFVRRCSLKGEREWRRFCKGHCPRKGILPRDIPADPRRVYAKKGWAGMADWLGTNRKRKAKRKR